LWQGVKFWKAYKFRPKFWNLSLETKGWKLLSLFLRGFWNDSVWKDAGARPQITSLFWAIATTLASYTLFTSFWSMLESCVKILDVDIDQDSLNSLNKWNFNEIAPGGLGDGSCSISMLGSRAWRWEAAGRLCWWPESTTMMGRLWKESGLHCNFCSFSECFM